MEGVGPSDRYRAVTQFSRPMTRPTKVQMAVSTCLLAMVASTASQSLPETAVGTASSMQTVYQRQLTAVGGRGGFGGFSRGTATRPATVPARPPTAAPTYRAPVPAAPAGRAYVSTPLPGGFNAYGRPGFVSTPFILPFTAGLLTAAAVSSLARSPSVYCNGLDVQCYKAACLDALRTKCPDAAAASNNTLVLSACPDTRYTECYRSQDFNSSAATSFECFGVRRPRYGREDVAAVCHRPGSSSAGGTARLSKVLVLLSALTAAVLVLVWL